MSRAILALQGQRGTLAPQGQQVSLEIRVQQAQQDQLVPQAQQVPRAQQVSLEIQVRLARLVHPAQQDSLGLRVHLRIRAQQERQVGLVLLASQALQEVLRIQVPPVSRVHREHKEIQVLKVIQEKLDHRVIRVRQALPVYQALLRILAQPVRLV